MKTTFPFWLRTFVAVACFAAAIVGFMIKLPSGLRHMDKELHAAFYFFAAAFLNLLFAGTKFTRHAIIFMALYLFGMAIEYAQAYSNRFFRQRIHGRYDPEDIQYNFYGLVTFSVLWIVCVIVILVYRKATLKTKEFPSN